MHTIIDWTSTESVDAAIARGDWRVEKIVAQREWVKDLSKMDRKSPRSFTDRGV